MLPLTLTTSYVQGVIGYMYAIVMEWVYTPSLVSSRSRLWRFQTFDHSPHCRAQVSSTSAPTNKLFPGFHGDTSPPLEMGYGSKTLLLQNVLSIRIGSYTN